MIPNHQQRKTIGCEDILVNPSRGGIARKFQLFHRYNSLLEDTYLHFNIIGDIPQLYARDCTEKVILCVQKYESVQRCNK